MITYEPPDGRDHRRRQFDTNSTEQRKVEKNDDFNDFNGFNYFNDFNDFNDFNAFDRIAKWTEICFYIQTLLH